MSTALFDRVDARPQVRSALATLADLSRRTGRRARSAVFTTGFDPLDEVLGGGVQPGEVLLFGGKPGVGKTVACLQSARAMAQNGIVVLYLCYEHDDITLLTRLLSCELGEIIGATPAVTVGSDERQARLRDVAAGALSLAEALDADPLLDEALRRVTAYADRLIFVTGSAARMDITAIGEITRRYEGQPLALFVDYLQKVPVYPAVPVESERVGRVMESLKELALDQQLVVVAIAAADREGLDARRLHLRHFRGSTALAYEADAVVVLNEKLAVVSRRRLRALDHPSRGVPARGRLLRREEPQRRL